MTSNVTGVDASLRAIGKAKANATRTVEDSLNRAGQAILKKALTYVPRDTGALAASGQVKSQGKGLGTRVSVSFGGSSAPYALYVHENLDAYHAPPTCAKFLERAVRETRGATASLMQGRQLEAGTQGYVTDAMGNPL